MIGKPTNVNKMIFDGDLIPYLQKLRVYDLIISGQAKCHITGQPITLDNLEMIIPSDDQILFVCTDGLPKMNL